MIRISSRAGKRIAVVGLGSSGLAAAAALRASGASVLAWDDSEAARRKATDAGMALTDVHAADWSSIDALVLSPGIPLTHPAPHRTVGLAAAAGRPVIGDIELLIEAMPQARTIGITGTNGKSTTTALIGHILAVAGRPTEVGGNLGRPALTLAPLGADGWYVLELSSFQLDLMNDARLDVAVWLNITPDHLDRHGSMEGYVAAKRRIFRDRGGGRKQTAVIGVDDGPSAAAAAALTKAGHWRVVPVSVRGAVPGGVFVDAGRIYDATRGEAELVADIGRVATLPGSHNWQNAALAYAAARAAGLDVATIAAGLASYPGLAHRQELVATINGIRYVNDSKATNPDAAARATACYDPIYWIAGGKAKTDELDLVAPYFARIRHAFLIGAAAAVFARILDGKVAYTHSGDLARALADAHRLAQAERLAGAVVLLSPACASFDQWRNFEERGDAFRAAVQRLAAEAAA
ncbi:MAG: UDP-N-acetylmuramoyl-L-alanine--D-glutamate ligase [Alphaproteobacteria bacterium]|nr:UDP-N-acetylmuramoyl-L-alanine--D-glutamate ligase [Alphaproteobacteria bacterium]